MRLALRWTSLGLVALVLYRLGAAGFHHRRFSLFLALLLGFATLIAVVFAATGSGEAEE